MWRRAILPALILAVCLAAGWALGAGAKTMSVQVRQGELRASPSFLGAVRGTVSYGARLTVLEEQGPWARVTTPDSAATGWIHSSALTSKRIVLRAGERDAELAASSGELALAGKGFNAEVEAEFKTRNRDIDFSWVDRMERINVAEKEMHAFLQQGALEPPKGDAQ